MPRDRGEGTRAHLKLKHKKNPQWDVSYLSTKIGKKLKTLTIQWGGKG